MRRPSSLNPMPLVRPTSDLPCRMWGAWRTRMKVVIGGPAWRVCRTGSSRRAADEGLGAPSRLGVGVLARGRLHEVARRPVERAADAAVERQLGAAHRIDDDASRVR